MCLLIKYNKTLQISYAPFPSLPAVVILIQQIICFREIALSFIFRTDFSRISINCVLTSKHLPFPAVHIITAQFW